MCVSRAIAEKIMSIFCSQSSFMWHHWFITIVAIVMKVILVTSSMSMSKSFSNYYFWYSTYMLGIGLWLSMAYIVTSMPNNHQILTVYIGNKTVYSYIQSTRRYIYKCIFILAFIFMTFVGDHCMVCPSTDYVLDKLTAIPLPYQTAWYIAERNELHYSQKKWRIQLIAKGLFVGSFVTQWKHVSNTNTKQWLVFTGQAT
jgi:uncharacterized membrane protein